MWRGANQWMGSNHGGCSGSRPVKKTAKGLLRVGMAWRDGHRGPRSDRTNKDCCKGEIRARRDTREAKWPSFAAGVLNVDISATFQPCVSAFGIIFRIDPRRFECLSVRSSSSPNLPRHPPPVEHAAEWEGAIPSGPSPQCHRALRDRECFPLDVGLMALHGS